MQQDGRPVAFSRKEGFYGISPHFVNSINEPAHKRLNVCRPLWFCPKDQRQMTIFILHSLDEDNDKQLSLQCFDCKESNCNPII